MSPPREPKNPETPWHERDPVRQFRVTVTEDLHHDQVSVLLSWRTFPCAATHWDGHWATVVPSPPLPITSQEALREVLATIAARPWVNGVVHK